MTSGSFAAASPHAGRIARLALEFWHRAGDPPGFPRDPEPSIPLQLPVAVDDVPALTCGRAAAHAARLGFPAVPAAPDRPLRGCLVAVRGRGLLLLDPRDPPDERRLTVAHELGHYLIEVYEPRGRAVRALGPAVAAVLDGERPATFDERLGALLADAPLAPYVHLMARDPDGEIGCPRVFEAECGADAFARELLAPRAELRPEVVAVARLPLQQRWAEITGLLQRRFGLPIMNAGGYAQALVRDLTGGESVREWLGLPDEPG
jgi:hypothetical protein